jgi:predicted site-specific integrase-resolvase
MANPDLVGSAEACETIGVDRSTLTRWVKSGKAQIVNKLPGQTGVYLFTRAEVERLKREQDGALAS